MSDDAFNEVQLSGKQLAFLFMAWAAVSVVVFLLGVMVGRGVRDASGGSTAPVVDTAAVKLTSWRPLVCKSASARTTRA